MIRRLLLPDMMIWHCAQFQMRASVPFSLHQNIHRAPLLKVLTPPAHLRRWTSWLAISDPANIAACAMAPKGQDHRFVSLSCGTCLDVAGLCSTGFNLIQSPYPLRPCEPCVKLGHKPASMPRCFTELPRSISASQLRSFARNACDR